MKCSGIEKLEPWQMWVGGGCCGFLLGLLCMLLIFVVYGGAMTCHS